MIELIDINTGLNNAIRRRRNDILLFSVLTMLICLLVTVLMLTSKEKYFINLIFTLIGSIAYCFYLVFYFSIIRKRDVDEYHFYDVASKASFEQIDVIVNSVEKKTIIRDGIEFYVLNAKVIGNLEDVVKTFHLLVNVELKEGSKATLKVFGQTVVSLEVKK